MSTSYITKPQISYSEFVNSPLEGCEIIDPPETIFIYESKVIVSIINGKKNYVTDNGFCKFTRFGANVVVPILELIIKTYNVEVYGLKYPDCYY